MELANGLNCSSPDEAAGKQELRLGAGWGHGSRWDLDSSKAKSTSTQGECSREQLKTVPSSLEGFQQRWGQRWMMSLSPVQEMCWVVRRPTDAVQLMRGACTLARCFGFSSWFLFSWFMQRKGAQRHDPGRVGIG